MVISALRAWRLRRSSWVVLAGALGCAAPTIPTGYAPDQIAESTGGMVVTASSVATDVGARVLEAGGNAVDAAVAAAFALAVAEPTMSGLGGRTQMLIRTADGTFVGLDGGTEVPASTPAGLLVTEEEGGYEAIGIPGTVLALTTALERFGTRSLADVLSSVIPLAEDGVPLAPSEAARIAEVADRLRPFDGSRRHFLRPDGTPPAAGEVFRQPALARVLRALATDGPDVFYRGWIADSIDADMRANGGFLRREDLAGYRVRDQLVVRGRYRHHEIVGTYLPASGATTIEALQILEHLRPNPGTDTATWVTAVASSLLASFVDRTADLGPPGDHAATIVSPEWAERRAASIGLVPATAGTTPESPFTTHVSVTDGVGGAVALTQSVGPNMGSRVVAPGLGFVYAATMGYLADQRPGDRPFSSQSPIMLLVDGELAAVLGASGARRIISSLVTTVSRMVDDGVGLAEAVAGPRLHPSDSTLYVEHRDGTTWRADVLTGIDRERFEIVARDDASYFAAIHGIEIDRSTGRAVGVAEPRRSGSARGVNR